MRGILRQFYQIHYLRGSKKIAEIYRSAFLLKYCKMKKLIFLFIIIIAHFSFAQAADPDFNDKMAFSEGRSHLKKATFIESADYAS